MVLGYTYNESKYERNSGQGSPGTRSTRSGTEEETDKVSLDWVLTQLWNETY
jgi:hypothetical protein